MGYFEALVLGILQGLAEFLPVSSSGHLAIMRALFELKGAGDGALFEILLHLGSAAAIMIVFWPRIAGILRVFPAFFMPWSWRSKSADPSFRMASLVLLGSVPAGAVGLVWGTEIEALFGATQFIGWMLVITGAFLLATRALPVPTGNLTPGRAFAVGCVQALAVVPGISRSGSTISGGLACGLRREMAGEFSFLLGLVAIVGANLLELPKLAEAFGPHGALNFGPTLVGCSAAFVVSWMSLRWLLRFVARGQLWFFGPYCLLAGASVVLWM